MGREHNSNSEIDAVDDVDPEPRTASEPVESGDDNEENPKDEAALAEEQETEPDADSVREMSEEQLPDVEFPHSFDISVVRIGQEDNHLSHEPSRTESPRKPLDGSTTKMQVSIIEHPSDLDQEIPDVEHQIKPLAQNESLMTISVAKNTNLARVTSEVELPATNEYETAFESDEQSTIHREFLPMDEDPIFKWTGGVPYGNRRPTFIIHRDDSTGESLSYLKRVLRDHYKTIEGGEPAGASVDFVANKPNIPAVNNRIIVLDVSGDEWDVSTTRDNVKITRNDRNIVPDLEELASTTFTGKLGYFVLNISPEWFDALRTPAEPLLNQLRSDLEEVVEDTTQTNVLIAEPKPDQENWARVGCRYFGLEKETVSETSQISEIEAQFDQLISHSTWEPISLTSLQSADETDDGESDEHYLYKSAIVDSIAFQLFVTSDEHEHYTEFVNERVSEPGLIFTEKKEDGYTPDVQVHFEDTGYNPEQIDKTVLPIRDADSVTRIAFEFETGRQQAAHNYRKLRSTLDKYRGSSEIDFIAVVIPPALIHMGKEQAHLLQNLVDQWNETSDDVNSGAELFVPTIGIDNRGETKRPRATLEHSKELINRLYPEDNE